MYRCKFIISFETIRPFHLEDFSHYDDPASQFTNFLKMGLPACDPKNFSIKYYTKDFYAKTNQDSDKFYNHADILTIKLPKEPLVIMAFLSVVDIYFAKQYNDHLRIGADLITKDLTPPKRRWGDESTDPAHKAPISFFLKRVLHLTNQQTNLELMHDDQLRLIMGAGPNSETQEQLPIPLCNYTPDVSPIYDKNPLIQDFLIQAITKSHPYFDFIKAVSAKRELDKQNEIMQSLQQLVEMPQRVIKNLAHSRMMFLLQKCIGKPAHDKRVYNLNYTELWLIQNSEFTFTKDGLMIVDLSKNIIFKKLYAEGQRLHSELKPELEFLGTILGWEFDASCDFKTQLVFTKAFTQSFIPESQCLFQNVALFDTVKSEEPHFKTDGPVPVSESFKIEGMEPVESISSDKLSPAPIRVSNNQSSLFGLSSAVENAAVNQDFELNNKEEADKPVSITI